MSDFSLPKKEVRERDKAIADGIIAARDKWWIDRVGEDIIEVFLNLPMNEANKETLLKTWQRLKNESEAK
jgi:hypothetical protein